MSPSALYAGEEPSGLGTAPLSGKGRRARRQRRMARLWRACRRPHTRSSDSRPTRFGGPRARARRRNGHSADERARTPGAASARASRSRHRRTRRETQRSDRPSPTTRRRTCPSARSARSPRGEGPRFGLAALPAPRAAVYAAFGRRLSSWRLLHPARVLDPAFRQHGGDRARGGLLTRLTALSWWRKVLQLVKS